MAAGITQLTRPRRLKILSQKRTPFFQSPQLRGYFPQAGRIGHATLCLALELSDFAGYFFDIFFYVACQVETLRYFFRIQLHILGSKYGAR